MFYRRRGTAADEFGKLGTEFGTDEDSAAAVLVSRSADVRKKASAIDAMMSICKVRMSSTVSHRM